MRVCSSCGEENPDKAKFCSECATPLTDAEGPRETRKTVTVMFADMSGSTVLGERLDPEALRVVIERYFDAMKAEIERHGGLVEKFIGDAVMAVFGIPRAHEDDALRAIRAAMGLHRVLAGLNVDLERDHGVAIRVRVGINTGEVVTGDSTERQRLVTGDTVNVAARFEQAATPGEVLIGRSTYRLVRDAVEVEPLAPLELKGKSEPIPAFRVVRIVEGAAPISRRADTAFVGREREREVLTDALARVRGDRSCHLFTLLGTAGVGKSRLVAEVLGTEGADGKDVQVLSGRCLPYGDGITFWPVLEIVKSAAGITESDDIEALRSKLQTTLEGEEDATAIEATLAALLGLVPGGGALEETYWAVRRFLESLARDRPLVVVLDDLHWSAPPLLDLIEHLVDWSRDVPLLLLCLARPEFLDERPGWGGGKMNATTILLEPFDERDSSMLVENLLETADLPSELTERIVRAAEGNPLFVEELLAMLVDDGSLVREGDRWRETASLSELTLPSSIQALLAARLDQLEPSELRVIEGGAVVGQVFYRAALAELAPEALAPDVGTYLKSLMRKDLVRPEGGGFPGDETYRFRHILIRDAAYRSMPKRTRAEMHERFGDWLEGTAGERLHEFEEIVGHHLEQAHVYRMELNSQDTSAAHLSERAGLAFASAGRRAYSRGDMRATSSLLGRATRLLIDSDVRRLELLPDLSEALGEGGERAEAVRLLDDGLSIADGLKDARIRAHLMLARIAVWEDDLSPEAWEQLAEREAREALAVFEETTDDAGQANAWRTLGFVDWGRGRIEGAVSSWQRAAAFAGHAGDRTAEAHDRAWLLIAYGFGSMPVEEALACATDTLPLVEDVPAAKAEVLWEVASNHAMLGNFDEAHAAMEASKQIERDLGRGLTASHFGAQVEEALYRLEGDREARARVLRQGLQTYRQVANELNALLAALLAQALADLGQDEEAWELAEAAEEASQGYLHVMPYVYSAQAIVLAHKGQFDEAEQHARDAITILRRTEFNTQTADALMTLGEVLRGAGRVSEAVGAISEAIAIYAEKGIVPLVEHARSELAQLRGL